MARNSKLLAALDAHKGRDIEAEKRKKQVKTAEKRKRDKNARKAEENGDDSDDEQPDVEAADGDFASFSDNAREDAGGVEINGDDLNVDKDSDEQEDEDDEDQDEDEDSGVPLSEVSGDELEDTIPHQRLTINNGPALLTSQSRIALLRKQPKKSKTPFHIHNSLVSTLPPANTAIPDPNDDLTRELEFYRIARAAALEARTLLTKEKIPFTRPADYFAEMVKSDTHMDRIKNKMRNEAAEKKGRQEARRQRDAKKFGKQVQIAKEQERAKAKRDILDKVKDLKRKRKGNASEDVREDPDNDMFEAIAVEKPGAKSSSGRERGRGDGPSFKRQKKDAKFGFGGSKRFSKSGDAESTGDMRGFSAARMKGRGGRGGGRGGMRGGSRGATRGGGRGGGRGRGGSQRPGKSRREAAR